MTETFRPVAAGDLDALFAIALATGDSGGDATALYADPHMIGHIYAAPYALLLPEYCFVVADAAGVAGYVVGAPDTIAFAARLEIEYWPALRRRYPDPGPPPHRDADAARRYQIYHPDPAPAEVVAAFAGHMHLNVLPRRRGRGAGRRLCTLYVEAARRAGVTGVHVGVSRQNTRGIAFWRAMGFAPLDIKAGSGRTALWFGREI